ncbi:MAG: hypothetical protein ACFFD2_23960 [Promethearchaeota archaeon]
MNNLTFIKKLRFIFKNFEDEITQREMIINKYVKNGLNHIECEILVGKQDKEKLTSSSMIVISKF